MERMHLHVRAVSPPNEDQVSPNVFLLLCITLVKIGDIAQCLHINLFISVFILSMTVLIHILCVFLCVKHILKALKTITKSTLSSLSM